MNEPSVRERDFQQWWDQHGPDIQGLFRRCYFAGAERAVDACMKIISEKPQS